MQAGRPLELPEPDETASELERVGKDETNSNHATYRGRALVTKVASYLLIALTCTRMEKSIIAYKKVWDNP